MMMSDALLILDWLSDVGVWPYNDVSMCENIYIIPGQQFYMLDDDARIISNLWHHKVDHFMWGAHFIKQDITQPAE